MSASLKEKHYTDGQLTDNLAHLVRETFGNSQLRFGPDPFDRISVVTCFEDDFAPSLYHQTEGIKSLFAKEFPDVEKSPEEVRQKVAASSAKGEGHEWEDVLQDLADDPKTVAAQIAAHTGEYMGVHKRGLHVFLKRPPRQDALAQRLSQISGLPIKNLCVGQDESVFEFDNFILFKSLFNVAFSIRNPVQKSGAPPMPVGERKFYSYANARVNHFKFLPGSKVPDLYRFASLVGHFIKAEHFPYDILGFEKDYRVRKILLDIHEWVVVNGRRDPSEEDPRTIIRNFRSKHGERTSLSLLARGLPSFLDDLHNRAPNGFYDAYSALYHAHILLDARYRNKHALSFVTAEDRELFLRISTATETLNGLRSLAGDYIKRFLPQRSLAILGQFEVQGHALN